ncbi:MAG: TOBE domain-containing protein, partial [Pseudomonadota bacterium]
VGLFDENAPAGASQVGLRPENIRQGDGKDATVLRVEHLGDQTRLHLKLMDHDVTTLTDPHTTLAPGQTIQIAAQNPLFFDAAGARIT